MTTEALARMLDWGGDYLLYISIGQTLFPVGAIIGVMMGRFSGRYGRRKYLMISCMINIVSVCINMIPNTWTILIARGLQGVVCGIGTTVVPLYNAEFVPTALRSKTGMLYGAMINIGIVIAYLVSLPLIWLPNEYVLVVFICPGIVGTVQIILFLTIFTHEPYPWYFRKGRNDEGRASIEQVYRPAYVQDKVNDFETGDLIRRSSTYIQPKLPEKLTYCQLACSRKYRYEMFLSVMLAVLY